MEISEYDKFIESKSIKFKPVGIDVDSLNENLFDFQYDIVKWALKIGRAAIFADCGMGKTLMQLSWANQVVKHTGKNVLILSPLAVAEQTVREGEKFGISVKYKRDQSKVEPGITITNYEMVEHFDHDNFIGVVLDESSILKSFTGKTRNTLIDKFKNTQFRLCCTATPAPNDHMELGNHSEFLGVMSRVEMLSMYFVHDGGDTSKWRLKGHAEEPFWQWLCAWAVNIRKPSDLGYDESDDKRFALPEKIMHEHIVESKCTTSLFPTHAETLQERRQAKRDSLVERCNRVADIVNGSDENWIIWCELNDESKILSELIDGSIEVKGSDSDEHKINAISWFTNKDNFVIIGNKLQKEAKCGIKNITKIEEKNIQNKKSIEKKGSLNQEIQSQTKNTCENIKKETQKNLKRQKSSKKNIIEEDEKDMQLIKNIEIQSKSKSNNIMNQIQTSSSIQDSKSMVSIYQNIEECLNTKMVNAQYVDAQIQDVQKKRDFMLTMTTKPGELEDYCAQTATKQSENFTKIHKTSGVQQNISKKVLISKPKMFGYGLNLQNCHNVVFASVSDSFEQFYQATRRVYRYGQKSDVNVHIVMSESEGAVVENIKRKEQDSEKLANNMVKHMADINRENIRGTAANKILYKPKMKMEKPSWM